MYRVIFFLITMIMLISACGDVSENKYVKNKSAEDVSKNKYVKNKSVEVPIAKKARWTDRYDDHFRKYSKRFFGVGFDWYWFKSQSIAESNLDPDAESWVGAKGLMQIMPATYNEIENEMKGIGNVQSARWNIAAGIYYDRKMYNKWKSDRPELDRLAFMFGSYNAGFGNILKGQKQCNRNQTQLNCNLWNNITLHAHKVNTWRYEETLEYVSKIFRFMNRKL